MQNFKMHYLFVMIKPLPKSLSDAMAALVLSGYINANIHPDSTFQLITMMH